MLYFPGLPGVDDKRPCALTPGYTSNTEWGQPPQSCGWVLDRYNDTVHLSVMS